MYWQQAVTTQADPALQQEHDSRMFVVSVPMA
jgi:hypothetical protein